jgi:hypothetical protein
MNYNDWWKPRIEALNKELEYAKAEAASWKQEANDTSLLNITLRELLGNSAAVGEVTGPNRGVVEDIEDLRRSRDKWKQEWELSERNKMDREADLVKLKCHMSLIAKLAEV